MYSKCRHKTGLTSNRVKSFTRKIDSAEGVRLGISGNVRVKGEVMVRGNNVMG